MFLGKLAGAIGSAFGGGGAAIGGATQAAGGSLKDALMQRAMKGAVGPDSGGGAAQAGQLPEQANGTPQGVPFGTGFASPFRDGYPKTPPTQSSGIWAKLMGNNRQMMNGSMPPQQPAAPSMPPNAPVRVPQALDRFANGQQIQDAYRNNWQPNPVLLRAELGE